VSALVVSLSTAGTLLAQKPAAPPESPATQQPGGSAPATTLRMQGTIRAYDSDRRQLSLSTTSGVVQFSVPESARVRLGGRRIEQKALATLTGYSAAVHYSMASGRTTLRSVDVLEKNERTRP
jgi:hypothetical protein